MPLQYDKDNGFAYLNAAVNSHYSKMIIIDNNNIVHPTDGAEDTEYYRARFNQETHFITPFSEIYGKTYKTYKKADWTNYGRYVIWMFCKPKPSLNIHFNK